MVANTHETMFWGISMNCPSCGTRVRVIDSKHADSHYCLNYNCAFLERVNTLVGWYCQDWVYRKRVCPNPKCTEKFDTIEILCDDLASMFTSTDKSKLKEKGKKILTTKNRTN